ncbi:T9SS type B sorting domain-containing protein, partial [Aurantibacter aestuarii]
PTPQILDTPTTIEICDNATADGFATFDLTTNNTQILDGLDPANYEITYYTSQANAEAPSNPITSPTAYNNTTAFNQTVWVRVEDDPNPTGVTNGCYSVVAMNLVVNANPVLVQPDPLQLCDENNPGDEQEFFTLEDANAQILNGQTGIVLSYHLTQNGANTDTQEITSPYENVVNPQTVFVRAENSVTGCISTTTLTLQVNPLPSPLANPAPLTACDTDNDGIFDMFDLDSQTISILNGEPNVTITYHETEQNAISGAMDLSSPYENIQPFSQLLWVRAENNTTGCYRIVNLELQVLNSPVIPNNIDPIDATPGDNIYIVCDDNNDGFNVFNFDMNVTPVVLGTQNPADFPISYYTTQNNAISGINPITNTASYPNVTNPQTIWVRLDNANGCETIRSFQIEVEFPPVIVTPTVLNACDDLDANYYEDNDGFTTFDLTVKDGEITNNDPSLVVSYHTTAASAQAGTVTIPDPTMFVNTVNAVQTIYVRVVDANTGCFSTTTLTVRVRPNPSPTQNPMDIELCDDNNSPDGIEVFDLTQNAVDIINGEPNVSLTYYTDLNEALAGVNFIVDPTMHSNEDPANPGTGISPQTIYVRVTSGSDVNGTGGTGCYTIVDFDIIVNPLPVIPTDDLDIRECEPNTDNVFTFDLTQNTPIILGAQDGPNYAVTYHTTLLAAQNGAPQIGNPAAFTNSSNPQEIFVNISNTTTGCEIATLSFFIEVNDDAVAYPYANVFEVCDDNMEFDNDTTNDSATFDLSTQDAEVLGNDPTNPQPAADFAVSYYETQADADAGTNPLPTLYNNIVNPQVIYVRVDNNIPTGTPPVDGSFCYDVTTLTLQVNPMPSFNLDDMYLICASTNGTEVLPNDVIDTGLSAANYSFEWYLNGTVIPGQTGPTLAPQEGGSYAVIVTDNVTGCSSDLNDPNANTIVEVSTPPVITAEVVTDAFSENHTIQVTATGDGISEFEFSLDGGAYVSNEPNDGTYTFTDVSAGEHVITVRDKNGCGEASATVLAMDYPLFFTPNGDGYNDTWNIYGIANQPDATIYIFDRMGKLLKQISPTGAGWDGTYNGEILPTSDYWFTVEYREPNSTSDEKKQFRGHFTLKR